MSLQFVSLEHCSFPPLLIGEPVLVTGQLSLRLTNDGQVFFPHLGGCGV
jgi:hypothetical protein